MQEIFKHEALLSPLCQENKQIFLCTIVYLTSCSPLHANMSVFTK